MRLAFYLDDGLICGGAERVAQTLLRHWTDAGWEVYLISRRGATADFYAQPGRVKRIALVPNNERPVSQAARHTPRWLPGRSLLRFFLEARRLRRHLAMIAPDVAIAFLTPGNTKLIAAAIGLDCRVIVSERTDLRARRYPLMWRLLRRMLYPRADLVTANAREAVEILARYVPREKLAWLPNPVHLPSEDALASAGSSRRIVCAGRLIPDKRHALLIKAFAMLGASHREWQLDICGDGPLRDELQSMIGNLGLHDRVVLHGQTSDMEKHWRDAEIFVLPSAYEGTPNALLEAMAHALPCIVSDSISCARTLVADAGAGVLFSSGNAADLAEKLVILITDPALRRAMGRSGRETLAHSPYVSACACWNEAIFRVTDPSRESAAP